MFTTSINRHGRDAEKNSTNINSTFSSHPTQQYSSTKSQQVNTNASFSSAATAAAGVASPSQVKVKSVPYSFSQQMPMPNLRKVKTPTSFGSNGRAKTESPETPAASKEGSTLAKSSSPTSSVWTTKKGTGLQQDRPTTAAQVVASASQKKVDENAVDEDAGAIQDYEFLSALVPKTSYTPKIPGRVIRTKSLSRSSGRGAASSKGSNRAAPAAAAAAVAAAAISTPTKPVARSPPSTRMQSLSSSSASVERKRKALGESAAAAASVSASVTSTPLASIVESDLERDATSSVRRDLENLKLNRGGGSKVSSTEEGRQPEGRNRREKVALGQSSGRSVFSTPARSPRRTYSQHNGNTAEKRRNPIPRSMSSLSPSPHRGGSLRNGNPSQARVEHKALRSGQKDSLSKIVELRKGGNSRDRDQKMESSPRARSPPPGFGRVSPDAFFKEGEQRRSTSGRMNSKQANGATRGREVASPRLPVPVNSRADNMKKALRIGEKKAKMARGESDGVEGGEKTRTSGNGSGPERSFSPSSASTGKVQANDTKNSSMNGHKEEQTVRMIRVDQGRFEEMQRAELDILSHVPIEMDLPEPDQSREKKKKPGVIGTPASSRALSETQLDQTRFSMNGDATTQRSYTSLFGMPNYPSQILNESPEHLGGSPMVGYTESQNAGSANRGHQNNSPFAVQGEFEYDAFLRELGIKPPAGGNANNSHRQQNTNAGYYRHF